MVRTKLIGQNVAHLLVSALLRGRTPDSPNTANGKPLSESSPPSLQCALHTGAQFEHTVISDHIIIG